MMTSEVMQMIIQILIAVLVAIVIRYLAPLLVQSLRANNYELAAEIVEHAVQAAEQVIRGYNRGDEKYLYAITRIRKALEENNIKISQEQIDQMIEAAVYALDYYYKPEKIPEGEDAAEEPAEYDPIIIETKEDPAEEEAES